MASTVVRRLGREGARGGPTAEVQGLGSRETAPRSARALAFSPISVSSAAAWTTVSSVPCCSAGVNGGGGGALGAGVRVRTFAGGRFAVGPLAEADALGAGGVFAVAVVFLTAAVFLAAVGFLLAVVCLPAAVFLAAVGFLLAVVCLPAAVFLAAVGVLLAVVFLPAVVFLAAVGFLLAVVFLAAVGVLLAVVFLPAAVCFAAADFLTARGCFANAPAACTGRTTLARFSLRRWGRVEGSDPITPARRRSLMAAMIAHLGANVKRLPHVRHRISVHSGD
jgi:hypothetical protein